MKMPAKSAAQYKLMQAIAHGKAKSIGPSKEVAKEIIAKTPRRLRSKFMRKK